MTDIIESDADVAETNRSRRQPMSRLLPEGSGGAVTHWLPTQWPRVGGVALAPLPATAFTEPACD